MPRMHSDFIIYADESGDHSLASIDDDYPLFVLAFCVVKKTEYSSQIVPEFQRLKFTHFGHDMIVLHAHEIRKSKGEFTSLLNPLIREAFYNDLNKLMEEAPITLIASAIKKKEHAQKYSTPWGPYTIALQFCMERAHDFLLENGQEGKLTHLIVESRGKKEDQELELEFHRIISNHYQTIKQYRRDFSKTPFQMKFAHKQTNSPGMQLADLVAHPMGRHVLKPDQSNRAYDVIQKKVVCLKIFP